MKKKNKTKIRILDYVIISILIVLLLTGIFCIQYYFNLQKNECLKSPFTYGARQLEDIFDAKAIGVVYIIPEKVAYSPYLTFNSTNFVTHYPQK